MDLINLTSNAISPFHSYSRLSNPLPWLFEALERVEITRTRPGLWLPIWKIFDEWAPLELDRTEPELTAVIEAVDDTIEAVRGDNGYAHTKPEERSDGSQFSCGVFEDDEGGGDHLDAVCQTLRK